MILLARNNEGYRNLMALCSEAAVSGFYYKPQVDRELLERYASGLCATSACSRGIISSSLESGDFGQARRWAEYYTKTFDPGCFYLEIQDHGITYRSGVSQHQLGTAIADLANEMGLPLVVTNDIYFVEPEDVLARDLLFCIGTNTRLDDLDRKWKSNPELYCKSPEEMAALYPEYPEAAKNTLEVAKKCNVNIELGKIILPGCDLPEEETESSYLRKLCLEGLKRRFGLAPDAPDDALPEEALIRLNYELTAIEERGVCAYFLFVADLVVWVRSRGIAMRPGRGSAPGSLVDYALRITEPDPLEYGLIFERFFSSTGAGLPDIDIDFDDLRRGEVIDYVRDKYGDDRVAQVTTFFKSRGGGAVRDVGRVMDYPFEVPDRISKMIPPSLWGTLDGALSQSGDLKEDYETDDDTRRIIDGARVIEDIARGAGIHACSIAVGRDALSSYVPVRYDARSRAVVTQYDSVTLDEIGLLKMDFLGLRCLGVIQDAIAAIKTNHNIEVRLDEIPFDDPETFAMLQRGETAGVFQMGSEGIQALLKRLKPSKFSEVYALNALNRPGPLGSGVTDDFIERKNSLKPIIYFDERLKPIMEETYGLVIYQEQIMMIARKMCGFSWVAADRLRKAMGKSKVYELPRMQEKWVSGAVEHGYDPALALQLWNDILPCAPYAFNKSHAVAYSFIVMQSAWLKAHYPEEFADAVAHRDRVVGCLSDKED